MKSTNTPYRKVLDEFGVLTNPITKEAPYVSGASDRGGKKFRKSNNRKGHGLLIRRIGVLTFEKNRIVKQFMFGKSIGHLVAS